jgi:osmotically-inducible protein OsmY
MANDRWRNDQDRYDNRDEGRWREEGGAEDLGSNYRQGQQGRESDYRGDGTIAQRGFGNERSGYDRDQGGGGYQGSRGSEGFGDRYRGGGAYGSDDRGMFGERERRRSSGGYGARTYDRPYQDQERRSSEGGDRDRGYGRGDERRGFGGNDYSSGFYGADQGYRGERQQRDYGEERGFWDRATDEVSSWFGDDDARRRRERDERQGNDWGGQSHRGRGPKGYTRSDERIQEEVCERLSHDHQVDASEIEVSVSGKEVTLSGTVDSREAKRRAEDIAEHVSGVTHVQNNLRVQQSGGSVGPVGAAASTTTGLSMEAGMPTGAASGDLRSSTGVSGTGSPATGSATGPQGTGLGGVEVGPRESTTGSAQRSRSRK